MQQDFILFDSLSFRCQEDQSNIAIDDYPQDSTDTGTNELEAKTTGEATKLDTKEGD